MRNSFFMSAARGECCFRSFLLRPAAFAPPEMRDCMARVRINRIKNSESAAHTRSAARTASDPASMFLPERIPAIKLAGNSTETADEIADMTSSLKK